MKDKLKVLGIIPARGGSKTVPKKNLRFLLGKPVIAYTILAAKESKYIDRLIVSTEDREIASVSESYGVEVIKRPRELSKDKSPIENALRHAVTYLEKRENYYPDIVALMQANVPVRKKGTIDRVISKLTNTKADSVVTIYEISQRPEWMKTIQKNRLKPYIPLPKEYRRQDLLPLYLLDGAVIAIRKKVLMKTTGQSGAHRFLGKNIGFIIEEPIYSVEIDNQWDLLLAEFILSNLKIKDEKDKDRK